MLRPWRINIELDAENKSIPLYKQLSDKLKQSIAAGTLKRGENLPSSREFAEILGVSRKTIVSAMDDLVFSGWVENRDRVGLFVLGDPSTNMPVSLRAQAPLIDQRIVLDNCKEEAEQGLRLVIDDGFPDTQLIPFAEFSRTYRQFYNRAARWRRLGYRQPQGLPSLRTQLSLMLSQSRGLEVQTENICLTRGCQMGLYLAANALLQPGDVIVVEQPCYANAIEAFRYRGLQIVEIPVDVHGLQVERLSQMIDEGLPVKALYVTPRYQYPTTVTLSMERRKALAALVEQHHFYVLEDDYGFYFQFTSRRMMPLSSMLPLAYAIYIGTFSKVFAPASRIGYVAASTEVIAKISQLRRLIDIQGDSIRERTFGELIANGEMRRHLKRITSIYEERLAYMAHKIKKVLGDRVTFYNPHGGLAVWLTLPDTIWCQGECVPISVERLTEALRQHGVSIPTFTLADGRIGVRIGYASLAAGEVDELVEILGEEMPHPTSPGGGER